MHKVMSVYTISNGYLLKLNTVGEHTDEWFDGVEKMQDTHVGPQIVIYAKDAVGIAEEIIAAQARLKLDLPEQMEMFGPDVNLGKKERT